MHFSNRIAKMVKLRFESNRYLILPTTCDERVEQTTKHLMQQCTTADRRLHCVCVLHLFTVRNKIFLSIKYRRRPKAYNCKTLHKLDNTALSDLSMLVSSIIGSRTLRPQDTSAPRHIGTTKLVSKFKTNHRWSCVSSELSWVEVSRLSHDHGTRVEVSRTTFLVSKCLEIGAEVSQSVLMPKCLVAEVSGNPIITQSQI